MGDDEFLSPGEVARLAPGLKQPHAIARRLRRNGLAAKVVGSQVIVSRVLMREWLRGESAQRSDALDWRGVS